MLKDPLALSAALVVTTAGVGPLLEVDVGAVAVVDIFPVVVPLTTSNMEIPFAAIGKINLLVCGSTATVPAVMLSDLIVCINIPVAASMMPTCGSVAPVALPPT